MANDLSHTLLSQISPLICDKMGLYFPETRWHDLARGLLSAAAACGFADASAYCHSLLAASLSRSQIEALSSHLTIGETYFFREKPTFHALRETIFPDLIRARRGATKQLRVWSAGCCTGEEAYSTAILLSQLIPDLSEWMLTILGTDINPQFLDKANLGVYGEWSFRDIPPNIKDRYFTQTEGGRFEILPSIKQLVKFAPLNLAEESYPSNLSNTNAMDVIFCRNVLMYFSPEQAKKVAHNLYHSLAEGGWLVASLGEASHLLFSDFKMVQFPNAILYQKQSKAQGVENPLGNWQAESKWASLPPLPPPPPELPTRWQTRTVEAALLVESPRQSRGQLKNIAPMVEVAPPLVSHPAPEAQASPSQHLFAQAHYAEAEREARAELVAKPEDGEILLLLARICANQGRLDEAVAWCKRGLAADRLAPRGYYLYATVQEARGEIDEAITALKRALYLNPEFVLAYFALGYLARRQGKPREADKHFANMQELLKNYQPDEILPESDGWTAGRLVEMVSATSMAEKRR